MNKIIKRSFALFLAVVLVFTAFPLGVFSLTSQQMEDIHRVKKLWQDEYNKMYISWLLDSDNFVYHLDVTDGKVINDPSFKYSALNLSYRDRKDNFVKILLAMIDYTNESMNQVSKKQTVRRATSEYFNVAKELVNDTAFALDGAAIKLMEAINLTSKEYLDFVYDMSSDAPQLTYNTMLDDILENVSDPLVRNEAAKAFDSILNSEKWLSYTKSFSTSLAIINGGFNLATNCLDALVEVESYRSTNDKYVEMLGYIRANTSDIALKEACNEVLTRLNTSYELNLIDCVLEGVRDAAIDSFAIPAFKKILSNSNVYARAIIFAYDAGTAVSNWLFNADDLKKHSQAIYAVNEISELLVPLLEKEISRSYGYINYSEATASYAASAIYHMRMLICLRRLGEESYYKLKGSAYGARLTAAVALLKWNEYTDDLAVIEKWRSDLEYAFNGIETSLFGNILSHHYYEDALETRDDFEILGTTLERYIGTSSVAYVSGPDIRTIGGYAFSGCESLKAVYISSLVEVIESYAFVNCPDLSEITIENNSVIIEENAFVGLSEDFTIHAYSGSSAEMYAIEHGINFEAIENPYADALDYSYEDFSFIDGILAKYRGDGGVVFIPYGVREIGSEAFKGCTNITEIIIPDTVTTIYSRAFYNCTGLTDIVIPDSVTQIGMGAFAADILNGERTITVGKGVTSGLREAFATPLGNNYVKLTVSPDNPVYHSDGNCIIETEAKKLVLGGNTVVIPSDGSVTSIGAHAFVGSGITEIDIPSCVTEIGERAFAWSKLEKISINVNVEKVSAGAFASCPLTDIYFNAGDISTENLSGLFAQTGKNGIDTRIVIGKSVSEIPERFFLNMKGVLHVSFEGKTQKIGEMAFAHSTIASITLPNSIAAVGGGAFYGCSFTSVKFEGSCRQWSEIDFGVDNEALLALTPQFGSHIGEWRVTSAPTCQTEGVKVFECTYCGNVETKGFTDPDAHDFSVEYTVDREATCTTDGAKSRHCKDCDAVTDVVIIPAAHDFEENYTVDREATCTVDGSMSRHCKDCDAVTDEVIIPAAHDFEENYTVDREATCTVDGSMSRHCKNCNEVTEEKPITAAHLWEGELTVDLAPTETAEGISSRHCERCEERCDVTVIPKLIPSSPKDDFTYKVRDGRVIITGYIGTSPIMSIPLEIDGISVTEISTFAFSQSTVITEAYIPYTLEKIGTYAFWNCTALTKVTLAVGIEEIPESVFSDCTALSEVSLPYTLVSIGENAFWNCTSLESVNIPQRVELIGNNAFYGTPWLSSLTGDAVTVGGGVLMRLKNEFYEDIMIPEGVVSIYFDYGAGIEETYVKTVYLPSTLKHYNQLSAGLYATGFAVDSQNPYFVSLDGALYTVDFAELVAFPSLQSGEFTLPGEVLYVGDGAFLGSSLTNITLNTSLTAIGKEAFKWCNNVESLVIPKSVTEIGEGAMSYMGKLKSAVILGDITEIKDWTFSGCYVLYSVLLPGGVNRVGSFAFGSCSSLEIVYFGGASDTWGNVIVDYGNDELSSANVKCADSLGFSGVSLEPESGIVLKYKVEKVYVDLFGYTNLCATFEICGISTVVNTYTEDGDYYVFTFSDIAPQMLGDTVSATLHYTLGGVELSTAPVECRAIDFCYSMLKGYSAEENVQMSRLLVDLINYGAMAQLYTGHNSDSLVNRDLTEEERLLGTVGMRELESVLNTKHETASNPEVSFISARLLLKGNAALILKFSTEDINGLSLKIRTADNEWIIEGEHFVYEGGAYSVSFEGLLLTEMSEVIYVTAYRGGAAVSNTLCYSIESYVYNILNKGDVASDMLIAMMNYGYSAKEYAESLK